MYLDRYLDCVIWRSRGEFVFREWKDVKILEKEKPTAAMTARIELACIVTSWDER
jgi:hypothetical protein